MIEPPELFNINLGCVSPRPTLFVGVQLRVAYSASGRRHQRIRRVVFSVYPVIDLWQ
jgi:hypothetical protein